MKKLCTTLWLCCLFAAAQAQFRIVVIAEDAPLAGATVLWKAQKQVKTSDSTGLVVFTGIPEGKHHFVVSHAGFAEQEIILHFPLPADSSLTVVLETEEEEEVVVTATRTSRTIANLPTRTEVISGEELEEKANMKPGDIRMLLSESTGIQTQQTSATSFNAGIRIQGLDGRYTQLLKDGYPMYAGFSGGLSILQIAPLDLKQVEVIKGSSSTLYGGGAIAGLVNLVSKTPGKVRDLRFLANATSARGLDLSGFYSERYGKIGLTVYGSRNSNAPFDPAGIALSAIPKFTRYTIHPRLFIYGKKTTADIGVEYITEDRVGGDMEFLRNGGSGYFEQNNTDRVITQLGIARRLSAHATLQLKNSYSRFDRGIAIPGYQFNALQQSSFSELTWNRKAEKADWVLGANVLTDDLQEKQPASDPLRDYHYNTFGLFLQNAWTVSGKFTLETGLRSDYVSDCGWELLPRVSGMWKVTPRLTTRLGGGYGYKTPTIFTEDAERRQFRQILPINVNATRNERSVGGNWDINFRTHLGPVGFTVNQLFFFTRLNRPLVLVASGSNLAFQNSSGHLDTRGIESNLRFTYNDVKLFIGYTYTDANTHFDQLQWLPLTARHRLNNVLMYEMDEKWKLGLEAYYYSKQQLSDGSMGRSYWITGFMAERIWKKFSLYVNFENFTDTRQTRYGAIYSGPVNNPVFQDIYAPLDGFVVNGGLKIHW